MIWKFDGILASNKVESTVVESYELFLNLEEESIFYGKVAWTIIRTNQSNSWAKPRLKIVRASQ